jgi:anti-sigma factor RsiW
MKSVNRDRCPVDYRATMLAYTSGRLTSEEAAAFEDHYLACPRCAEGLQFTTAFVRAVERAAKRLGRLCAAELQSN